MKPLTFSFDPPKQLKLGQTFQTVLDFEVVDGVVAEELRFEIYWQATNRATGQVKTTVVDSRTLHRGPLVPPQRMAIPLEGHLPKTGPLTWSGRLLDFQWGLRVVLEWAKGETVLFDVPVQLAGALRQRPTS